MKQIVEFLLEDGSSVFVQSEPTNSEGKAIPASRSGNAVIKAQKTFEDAIDKIKPAASTIINKIRSLHDSPDEVSIQFGLVLNAEIGAVVASSSIEANYSVTLKWSKPAEKKSKKH